MREDGFAGGSARPRRLLVFTMPRTRSCRSPARDALFRRAGFALTQNLRDWHVYARQRRCAASWSRRAPGRVQVPDGHGRRVRQPQDFLAFGDDAERRNDRCRSSSILSRSPRRARPDRSGIRRSFSMRSPPRRPVRSSRRGGRRCGPSRDRGEFRIRRRDRDVGVTHRQRGAALDARRTVTDDPVEVRAAPG